MLNILGFSIDLFAISFYFIYAMIGSLILILIVLLTVLSIFYPFWLSKILEEKHITHNESKTTWVTFLIGLILVLPVIGGSMEAHSMIHKGHIVKECKSFWLFKPEMSLKLCRADSFYAIHYDKICSTCSDLRQNH
jgi:hypothetical protein